LRGVIASLPNTPSWRGAQLNHRNKFTLTFNSYISHGPQCSFTADSNLNVAKQSTLQQSSEHHTETSSKETL